MTAFLVVAAIWCLPSVLVVAWVIADRIADHIADRLWPSDDPDTAWLDDLIAAEETPIWDSMHFGMWQQEIDEEVR